AEAQAATPRAASAKARGSSAIRASNLGTGERYPRAAEPSSLGAAFGERELERRDAGESVGARIGREIGDGDREHGRRRRTTARVAGDHEHAFLELLARLPARGRPRPPTRDVLLLPGPALALDAAEDRAVAREPGRRRPAERQPAQSLWRQP